MTLSKSNAAGAAAETPVHFRHEARILAMQALCQLDVQGVAFETQLDGFLSDAAHERASSNRDWRDADAPRLDNAVPRLDDAAQERASSDASDPLFNAIKRAAVLARGTWHKRADIARRISGSSESWSLDRMALIDRNILRLGVYELLEQPDTPFKVVIDEALELAHQFCDAQAPAFINGVLDAVRRKIHGENPAEEPTPHDKTKPRDTDN